MVKHVLLFDIPLTFFSYRYAVSVSLSFSSDNKINFFKIQLTKIRFVISEQY